VTSGGAGAVLQDWINSVLQFWFVETPRESWFRGGAAFDSVIQDRFGTLVSEVGRLSPVTLTSDVKSALAAVIVLDQFPRNIYRGTPQAFATDGLARSISDLALSRGLDLGLDTDRRAFLYLPFEHSEDLGDQDRSVALCTALGDPEYLRYAVAHRDVIRRFGRFPHRSASLGRISTREEIAALQEPGSSF
jgi:uncharacterized protein (DUF924 family)